MLDDTSAKPGADRKIGPDTDYRPIRRAIEFLAAQWDTHPGLDDLAAHLSMSPAHCQKLFKRWCGLSPKEFVQAITLERAKALLDGSASVLETAHGVGLSGASRLHDLFVTHEAMTPGEYKRRGEGLEIAWGVHPSPFGRALLMATSRGVAGLAFFDDEQEQDAALADMTRRWPAATYRHDQSGTAGHARRIFAPPGDGGGPVRLVLIGSDFDVRVWEALLRVPMGRAVSYTDLARHLGVPRAARAVGSAVGRNPISFVVPCHRVLRGDGNLGGYHWGLTRKRALIGWEQGRLASVPAR